MESTSTQSGLKRSLRLLHATALVVGTIIGASIFVQPSEITVHVPDITGVLLAWGAAGLLTLFGALACAELASAFPRTGGVYVFLNEAYSPVWGFLWGWAMFWVMHTGIIAAIAVVFARYTEFFIPVGPGGIPFLAIGAIVLLSAINYAGVRHGSLLQTAFTVGKVGAIAIIVVLAFWLGADRPVHFVYSATGAAAPPPAGVGHFILALIAGLFAFGGWHMVTYTAEETVDPERTIPKALIAGTLAVTACYVLLNAAYLYILPLDEVAKSTRVAADAAEVLVGSGGAGAVSALVMFSTFGGIAGIILAGPRVYYAMARDGLLFTWFAAIHPRYRTPHRAIVLQAVWASVLVWTGTYRQLFTRVIFTEWIFFGLMTAGLFLLRRRPGYRPAYRIWGYPVVPAVFVLSSAVIVAQRIRSEPLESAIGILIVGLGVPVYYLWARKGRPPEAGV